MPVIGDTVAPHMAHPDTNAAALRAADTLTVVPDDPAAAAEEIQRRQEEIGFSYFVFGAAFAEGSLPSSPSSPDVSWAARDDAWRHPPVS